MRRDVVITGGAGFLGLRLARRLIETSAIGADKGAGGRLILLDRPGTPDPGLNGAEFATCDVTDLAELCRHIGAGTKTIYHLATVVSGQAEAEFELGLAVNFGGARAVLDAARLSGPGVAVIGTSSLAVYGADTGDLITEATPTRPANSYGMAKVMAELLMQDYRRRGWADARTLRLPTIVVRPGAPNAAASSFASSMFREPLNGQPAICPVSADLEMWIASPETAAAALMHAPEVPDRLWPASGAVNVPGVTARVSDMLAALKEIAGPEVAARVEHRRDASVEAIVASWPAHFDVTCAQGLGFVGDQDFREILTRYKAQLTLS